MKVGTKKRVLRLMEMIKAAPVTRRAIRLYETQGLVQPVGRDHLGHRLYVTSDLLRVRLIRSLRAAGLSLSAIRDVLDSRAVRPDDDAEDLWIDRMVNVLSRQALELSDQIRAIAGAEREIREAVVFIRQHRGIMQKKPDQVLKDPATPLIVAALLCQPPDLCTTRPGRSDQLPPASPPGLAPH